MPKTLSYRIDLYNLVFHNQSKLFRKYLATYLLRIINKLGMKGRYIEQYKLPFQDVNGLVNYIFKKPYLLDKPRDSLLLQVFDELKFEYHCLLSSIKTRRLLCNDMTEIEEAFDILVNDQIKEISRNECAIAGKFLKGLNVDDVIDLYNRKFINQDEIQLEEEDAVEEEEDDDTKYISLDQIERQLTQHSESIPEHTVIDAEKRQTIIESKMVPKLLKDTQQLCECGSRYTKANYARHCDSSKHQQWLLNS